jgi:hypothetical protein
MKDFEAKLWRMVGGYRGIFYKRIGQEFGST